MPSSKNKKIPFIVFEGPDMCGKSTQVDLVLENLKKKGYKFVYFKYPVYDGYKGAEILNHLKTFEVYDYSSRDALFALTEHAVNLYVNKLAAFDAAVKAASKADGLIVDRFDMSQLIYDLAWVRLIKNIRRSEFLFSVSMPEIRNFIYEAINRAASTHEYYMKKFDVKYIRFERSEVIIDAVERSKNTSERRFDKYDANTEYQSEVSRLFEKLRYKETVDDLHIDFKTITAYKSFVDELFFNTLYVVDTDKVYNSVRNPTYSGDDVIMSEIKEEATSIIENEITKHIVTYMEENHGRKTV